MAFIDDIRAEGHAVESTRGVLTEHRCRVPRGPTDPGDRPTAQSPPALDLDCANVAAADRAGQTGAVGAAASMPKVGGAAEGQRPVDQFDVAGGVSGQGPCSQAGAEVVDREGVVDVLVGVDADDDSTGGPVACSSVLAQPDQGTRASDAGRSGGRDCDETAESGSYEVTPPASTSCGAQSVRRQINSKHTQTAGSVEARVRPPVDVQQSHGRIKYGSYCPHPSRYHR
jgi:hypothetical protein